MPALEIYTGELLIAIVTILWGIFVETWYVSRWTIFFNVVPLIVILMTLELGDLFWPVIIYTGIAMFLIIVTGHQGVKQVFGAKSYGTLMLSLTLYSFGGIGTGWAIAALIGFSALVYIFWGIIYHLKKENDERKAWNKQRHEAYVRQERQKFFQRNGYWPDW